MKPTKKIKAKNLQLEKELKLKSAELEKKDRELEIENCLKKVRRSALSLKKPEDMLKVCKVISNQLEILKVHDIRNVLTAIFDNSKKFYTSYEYYHRHNKTFIGDLDYTVHPIQEEFARKMLSGSKAFFTKKFQGQQLKSWIRSQKNSSQFVDKYLYKASSLNYYFYSFSQGAIGFSTYSPLDKSQLELFKRFRDVFSLAYRRFMDIQKAQAQAREAQIEAALERVRARAIAMHKSNELAEVSRVLYSELFKLDIKDLFNCGFVEVDRKNRSQKGWTTRPDGSSQLESYYLPLGGDKILNDRYNAWRKQVPAYRQIVSGAQLRKHLEFVIPTLQSRPSEEVAREEFPDSTIFYCFNFKQGYLHLITGKQLSNEQEAIMVRFSKAFEQTYTRFLDLQKAEAQVREAQIESALERVRARAMAMHKTEEFSEVVFELFNQMSPFGLAQWGFGLWLRDNENKGFNVWFSTPNSRILPDHYHVPDLNYKVLAKIRSAFRRQSRYQPIELRNNDKREWDLWLFENTGLKKLPPKVKKEILSAPYVQFSFSAMKYGLLQAIDVTPMPKELIPILSRFTKVFEQTYTRFLDLQKAEEQAREAQIEAGLERVRTRTMAMHKSSELSDVGNKVFQEIRQLGIKAETSWFWFIDKTTDSLEIWTTHKDKIAESVKVEGPDLWTFKKELDAWKKKKPFLRLAIPKKEAIKAIRDIFHFNLPDRKDASDFYLHHFRHNYGFLGFGAWHELDEEEMQICQRFAKVFDQTYTRFLDLKKAEAQAREAEIELALERVRARSMAMQKSEELKDVIRVIFEQLRQLNINAEHAGVVVDFKPKGDFHFWVADEQDIPSQITVPYLDLVWDKQFNEAKRKRKDFFTTHLNFKEKNSFYRKLLHHIPGLTKKAYNFYMSCPGLAGSTVVQKDIGLYVENFSGTPYSEEDNAILKRFGKVFQQTYTRFLDLQKAESQAREAQIALALERVRARTLAMHKSEELAETAHVLFEQFKLLGEVPDQITIGVVNEPEKVIEFWVTEAGTGKPVEKGVKAPIGEPILISKLYGAWKKKQKSIVVHLKGKELSRYIQFRSKLSNNRVQKRYNKANRYVHAAFFSKGFLNISTDEPRPASTVQLLERFADTFNLTYTRFLDLQKAEVQAREAQIEASLERVRARGMAMQTSEELQSLIGTLFTELTKLDLVLTRCIVWIIDPKTNDAVWWMANSEDPSNPMSYIIPYHKKSPYLAFLKEWKKRTVKWIYDLKGQTKKNWDDHLFTKTGLSKMPKFIRDGMRAPDRVLISASFSNFGGMNVASLEPLSDEHFDILLRIAKVFDLTYTRFNDLQKAEAQAREAEIEAGLERMRSRTIGMQKSEELNEVAILINQELRKLGFPKLFESGFISMDEEAKLQRGWLSDFEGNNMDYFQLPIRGDWVMNERFKSWKEGKPLLKQIAGGQKLIDHVQFALPSVSSVQVREQVKKHFSDPTYFYHSYFKEGAINVITTEELNEEQESLIIRVANVFKQTYTRFLDLQNAEAQAREAQIEAALERVRSRSLAMHNTSELQEVIRAVHKELLDLNISIEGGSFIAINSENKNEIYCWGSGGTADYTDEVHIPRFEKPFYTNLLKGIKKGPGFFTEEFTQKEKKEFFTFLFKHEPWSELTPKQKKETLSSPGGYTRSVCVSKQTSIFIINQSGKKFSEADNDILKRFGKVFEQAYTRFLDLKKAEAQAREAKIEAALERVRAKAMAMHISDDVSKAVVSVFDEIEKLGIESLACGLSIIHPSRTMEVWTAKAQVKGRVSISGNIEMKGHPSYTKLFNDWKAKKSTSYYKLESEQQVKAFYDNVYSQSNYKTTKTKLPDKLFLNNHLIPEGSLWVFTYEELSAESEAILHRFARVFGLTYRRYKDLQKAEAQAREAQIEASLERVRAKAMAMHNTNDLTTTAGIVFTELRKLGINPIRSGISIHNKENRKNLLYSATRSKKGEELSLVGWAILDYHSVLKEIYDRWLRHEDYFIELKGALLKSYYKTLEESANFTVPKEQKLREPQFGYFISFTHGVLYGWAEKPLEEEQKKIVRRFASVVDLTFKRYYDLKKAEEQAEEARIEAALEKVRARSLGMQKSEELREVIKVVFEQLLHLNFKTDTASFLLDYRQTKDLNLWIGTPNRTFVEHVPYLKHPVFDNVEKAKKKKKKQELLTDQFTRIEKNSFFRHYFKHAPDIPKRRKEYILKSKGLARSQVLLKIVSLFVLNYEGIPFTEKENETLIRFARVFEQAYIRFLDLQKAESQTREAQIENALEKVRSRSLGMQKSNELKEIVKSVFDRFAELGIKMDAANIVILGEGKTREAIAWTATEDHEYPASIQMRGLDNPIWNDLWRSREKGIDHFQKTYGKQAKDRFIDQMVKNTDYGKASRKRKRLFRNSVYYTVAASGIKFSSIQIVRFSNQQFSTEEIEILKRFSKVFEQSYIRFLDLQEAEHRAEEARIEAALEKVRARSLAMHRSEELQEVVNSVFDRLIELNMELDSSNILILSMKEKAVEYWVGTYKQKFTTSFRLDYFDQSISRDFWKELKKGEGIISKSYSYKEKNEWYSYAFKHTGFSQIHERVKKFILDGKAFTVCCAISNNVGVQANRFYKKAFTEKETDILKRFARVFDQAYTRFLDLKKAEDQAREAEIEAALERVRAKAMGMHETSDLTDAAGMVFTELRKLGINLSRCGVGLLSKETSRAQLYYGTTSKSGDGLSLAGWVDLKDDHPVLKKIYDSWLAGKDYFPVLAGKEISAYYKHASKGAALNIPDLSKTKKQHGTFIATSVGVLYSWNEEAPYSEEELRTMKRFATVVDLTFRRYQELQKAEANAKDAVKQAALDRIRADIASMRTKDDLNRITPIIWNELTTLGIPFIRCGVFIMDNKQKVIGTYLSTPEGKAITTFNLPYETPGKPALILKNWQQGKRYIDAWSEDDFAEFAANLVREGVIPSAKDYLNTLPKGGFNLHFLPFLQGMLYVANTEKLKEDDLSMIQSVAEAFSTAYARYEDFNSLEIAKLEIEKTLTELRQAQQQLIQSEKMASLGELTAGIAHEIQNPLNFVNNFSDVSNELLEEMNEEIKKGNLDEAIAIANDVKENLEKILHHGKRADGIVKGMLQHSRGSSNQKELTDINVLCDEYLRLSYHGLRAKDKTFNAKFESDFDKTIPKIEIVPQDMGRVILNLINNAFYAVNEKKREIDLGEFKALHGSDNYEPTVTITTRNLNDKIEIRVRDNGNGIPDPIKEKIFQPFFTTKPTGSGTGLGLSLSYDIVKAHGGEIKVESKSGVGTEFIIQLPA